MRERESAEQTGQRCGIRVVRSIAYNLYVTRFLYYGSGDEKIMEKKRRVIRCVVWTRFAWNILKAGERTGANTEWVMRVCSARPRVTCRTGAYAFAASAKERVL